MTGEKSMIEEYILQATTTDYELLKSSLDLAADIPTQEITLRIDEDDVEVSAFGIMYAISLLSFLQGRPAGISGIDLKEDDVWSVEDFFHHLTFSHGMLSFYADYVRGRLIKTSIKVRRDGTILITTVNRADLASQWGEYLQGKRHILEFFGEGGLGRVQ